jgi:hypothetical protein
MYVESRKFGHEGVAQTSDLQRIDTADRRISNAVQTSAWDNRRHSDNNQHTRTVLTPVCSLEIR